MVAVLRTAPEFTGRYLELVEEADGDPGTALAMSALAEFVAELAAALDRPGPVLERCLAAVEEVAAMVPDARELVGWAFLDSLTPEETVLLRPWLGPRTTALLDALDEDADADADDLEEGA